MIDSDLADMLVDERAIFTLRSRFIRKRWGVWVRFQLGTRPWCARQVHAVTSAKWDIVEIEGDPERVRAWFMRESGRKYDYLAWLGFLFRRERGSDSKWFCSEAIADCLGYRDAWRFDPNTLFVVLRRANDFNNKKVGE